MDNSGDSDHKIESNLTVATLYKFAMLAGLAKKRSALLFLCKSNGIMGTFLLAKEGINGTISGNRCGVETILNYIRSWEGIEDLEIKYSTSQHQNFNRMKVKIKKEIVTMGEPGIDVVSNAGIYVQPEEWNNLISNDDVIVIDARNSYEVSMGKFNNAVNPDTDSFKGFPDWADEFLSVSDKNKKIAMYCTGGIRCEKATAYIKGLGFGEVYHLKGGILKYLENVSERDSLWEGECFVFDERVSLTHGLIEGAYTLCYSCQQPISQEDYQSSFYERGVSCAYCYHDRSDEKKRKFRERQRQIDIAKSRGKSHLGDRAMVDRRLKRGY
tara:strand:+ start:211 stop:1191 length:981 start_codon:yes stop_codon:yes gene_type:complete